MTIPSRIQEILAEMERDPALATELRERILGQEFSQVPQAVAQNQNLITHMMERQIQLSEQFANAVEAQNQSLTRIENSVSEFRQETGSALERLEGRLDQGLGEVRSELSEFRQETQTHFEEVRSELSELRQETRSELRRTNGRLDRGFGANYEAKTTSNIRSILGQQLGIRNSRVLKGPNLRTDEDLESLLEQAESSGAITEEEADELLLLDLIVAGTHRADHARVYVAAEISITANQDDVNRAADRAEILWRVKGFPSSKTCSACGTVNAKLKRERMWTCPNCGTRHDRNLNAAINLRNLIMAVGRSRNGRGQESLVSQQRDLQRLRDRERETQA